jgi:hypothetical protein
MRVVSQSLFVTSSSSTCPEVISTLQSEPPVLDADWLNSLFDGEVPPSLQTSRWYCRTIENLFNIHIPAVACSVEDLELKLHNDLVTSSYMVVQEKAQYSQKCEVLFFD